MGRVHPSGSFTPRLCCTEKNMGHLHQLHHRVREAQPCNLRHHTSHLHVHSPVPVRRDPVVQIVPSAVPDEHRNYLRSPSEFVLDRRARLYHSGSARHLPDGIRSVPVFGMGALLSGISCHLHHSHVLGLAEGRPGPCTGHPEEVSCQGDPHRLCDDNLHFSHLCQFPHLHASVPHVRRRIDARKTNRVGGLFWRQCAV